MFGRKKEIEEAEVAVEIGRGDLVADKITGFTGVVICDYSTRFNVRRFAVQSQSLKDGSPIEATWFDENILELKEKGRVSATPLVSNSYGFGDMVRDTDTGLEGKVVGISQWLNGCVKLAVQSMELKDGKPQEAIDFATQRLELMEKAEPPAEKVRTGGPMDRKFKADAPSISGSRR